MITASRQNQRTKKQKYWQRHIEKWSQSGLSQTAYCREYKLKTKSFTYFKSRLKKKNLPVQFVQVPVEPVRAPSFLKLNIGSSFQIDIPDGFSQNTLTQVLQVLGGV
ncbi:IS66 family insertion sequence element accessory protein TnpB [Desulfobacula sp.]|uniref:IS66 family insertion sequence element accessory protein TnpA n=1 Tax=Desulfobacula sp. TaxID=2593537 RepID=UPI0025C1A8EA|nr:IS66 family insertion sequence element accessory protein TnpB [Desulfobacula sp.]MBC2705481.1 IS66 family insertion sequence element accessory protein TnpB [Desulfobacula sp.]